MDAQSYSNASQCWEQWESANSSDLSLNDLRKGLIRWAKDYTDKVVDEAKLFAGSGYAKVVGLADTVIPGPENFQATLRATQEVCIHTREGYIDKPLTDGLYAGAVLVNGTINDLSNINDDTHYTPIFRADIVYGGYVEPTYLEGLGLQSEVPLVGLAYAPKELCLQSTEGIDISFKN